MKIRNIGEVGLIERILSRVTGAGACQNTDVLVPPGDDAAVWQGQSGKELITTDTLVEGTHFDLGYMKWDDLGWKAMAVNISDIAAMGGEPLYAVVSLGLPADLDVDNVDQFYEGALELAKREKVVILGGDVVKSRDVFVTIAMIGRIHHGILSRSCAREGDLIGVTGPIGSSAAGMQYLQKRATLGYCDVRVLKEAHLRPNPKVKEGLILSKQGVKAALDISDGLVGDLSKMCLASKVAAEVEIDEIPVLEAVRQSFPKKHQEFVLSGGEDYQILFAAPPDVCKEVMPLLSGAAIVGSIVKGSPGNVTVNSDSGEKLSGRSGWDHFFTTTDS